MRNSISLGDDILDSRDIEARIHELEEERDALDDGGKTWAAEYPDESEELAVWLAVREQAKGSAPDWDYGTTLIHDRYFTRYAQDLADDLGALREATDWPLRHIDWDAAAEALQQDYTPIEVDSITYWVR